MANIFDLSAEGVAAQTDPKPMPLPAAAKILSLHNTPPQYKKDMPLIGDPSNRYGRFTESNGTIKPRPGSPLDVCSSSGSEYHLTCQLI